MKEVFLAQEAAELLNMSINEMRAIKCVNLKGLFITRVTLEYYEYLKETGKDKKIEERMRKKKEKYEKRKAEKRIVRISKSGD